MASIRYRCGCTSSVKFNDLNCCTHCHFISCNECQLFEVVGKYCPQCLDRTDKPHSLTCHRNCFECPRCKMFLNITSKKDVGDTPLGRMYSLKCQGCDWSYCTPLTRKVKSLTKYIEELEQKSEYYYRFENLRKFNATKMKLMNNCAKNKVLDLRSIDLKENDIWQKLAHGKHVWQILDEELQDRRVNIDEYSFPKQCQLRPLFKYFCPNCKNLLLNMDVDFKSLRSIKSSSARLPLISIVPHEILARHNYIVAENTLVLLIQNERLGHDVSVKISVESSLYVRNNDIVVSARKLNQIRKRDHKNYLQATRQSIPYFLFAPPLDAIATVTIDAEDLNSEPSVVDSSTEPIENSIKRYEGWTLVPIKVLEQKPQHEIIFTISFVDWNIVLYAYVVY